MRRGMDMTRATQAHVTRAALIRKEKR